MQIVQNALLVNVDVVRGAGSRTMMDYSQNDLQPNSQMLMKLFVFGGFSFRVLREDDGDNFPGHILCPRVYVVDSSSPNYFHIQKLGNGFLCDHNLDAHNIGHNVVITTINKSPEFLQQECVSGDIKTFEVVFPPLVSNSCVKSIPFFLRLSKLTNSSHNTSSFLNGVGRGVRSRTWGSW